MQTCIARVRKKSTFLLCLTLGSAGTGHTVLSGGGSQLPQLLTYLIYQEIQQGYQLGEGHGQWQVKDHLSTGQYGVEVSCLGKPVARCSPAS